MAATVFLRSSDQAVSGGFVSDEIVSPPNGSLMVQVNGTMEAAERWVIEQARVGDSEWAAVHRTDAPSSSTEWQGPRNNNRIFVFAVSDACRYRLRKVNTDTAAELDYNRAITGTRTAGLTAFWAEWQTRLSL